MNFYQHIPSFINPNAFSFGGFSVDWYSLMYLVAFATVFLLLKYRLEKKEGSVLNKDTLVDFIFYSIIGLLIGARLGYVFFYNFSFYWNNPLAIISPFDSAGNFIGLYGMSYHGGLIGVILATWFFTKKNKINFWHLTDFVIPAIPAGYFFGRLGNFLGGELYGRATDKFWGMYFPADPAGLLRHPSQLYEALGEGIILFIILWSLRNRQKLQGKMLGMYLAEYAIFRIVIEFWRMPDEQTGYLFNVLTLGQILSFIMLIFGVFLIFHKRKRVV